MTSLNAVNQISEIGLGKQAVSGSSQKRPSEQFEEVLRGTLKLSKHVADRIDRRALSLESDKMHRLEEAVNKAESKGANDSLVLLDDLAFLVSVKNRTVVTAMNRSNMKEGVFTRIDSAVIG